MTDLNYFQEHNIYNTSHFTFNGINTTARIIDIIDGDTIICIIPLLTNFYKFFIRLNGIDTCEIKSANEHLKTIALKAKMKIFNYLTDDILENYTREKIREYFYKNCFVIWLECKHFDKYGRILAEVYKTKNDLLLSSILLNEKLAYEYKGNRKLKDEEILKLLD